MKPQEACEYCDHAAVVCGARDVYDPLRLQCTRPKGHQGLHVACAAAPHEVAHRWGSVEDILAAALASTKEEP